MANDTWATPVWLFNYAEARYGKFDLDVCAAHDSYKCQPYYTIESDSLVHMMAQPHVDLIDPLRSSEQS